MTTSLDLERVDELKPLADLVRTIDAVVAGEWFMVGAIARDLLLHYGHSMPVQRFTVDADIAIVAGSWKDYQSFSDALVARSATRDRVVHRFHIGGWTLDVLPFGGVADDGKIAWPPEGNPVMSVLGFEEASQNTVTVLLSGDVCVKVASIPALFLLKVVAWEERHFERPRDDARDISMLLASYAASWNQDRLYDTAADLLEAFAFDNERAAAALLGRDAAAIASPATRERVLTVLRRETTDEIYKLAREMDGRAENNLNLLEAALFGLG